MERLRRWMRAREGTGPLCLVSACLCGIACHYDGKASLHPPFARLCDVGLAIAVCPEREGWLPVPRPACERVGDKVLTSDGEEKTSAFVQGAERSLALAERYGIVLAIFNIQN